MAAQTISDDGAHQAEEGTVCECKEIIISDIVMMPFFKAGLAIADDGIPAVAMTCRSCGYMMLVSAVSLKLVVGDGPPERITKADQ